ncbi:MAG: hypothetical protein FJ294_09680 [Planctomycetes bacterium]|nr:hypothetical protein [Planctomycetota bacterium]
MELPVRIVSEAPREPVISVDGSFDSPGLNLSHWPGNRTPRELRHDLSTGSALLFAHLAPAQRAELARGCVALANNHYDTDGLCALFAVRYPQRALELEQELLDVARAGDLFAFPSERALAVDAIVAAYADPARSPIAAELAGRDSLARHQLATERLLELLPTLLEDDLEPWRALWGERVARASAERSELGACLRDDLVHLDWTVWTAKPSQFAAGAPGRHALFGSTPQDRVLFLQETAAGTLARFAISTLSWFDLPSRSPLPRPDLAALASELNRLEGCARDAHHAWRAQPSDSPSPELWFGTRELELFSEHNTALRPSRIGGANLRRVLAEAQRDALVAALPQ